MVFGDQSAASCLYRPELAGAKQVVDELPGDAQKFSGFVGAVGEPLGEGVAREDLAHDGEQVLSRVTGEQSRDRFSTQLDWAAASGTAMSLPRLPRRRCLTPDGAEARPEGELPTSVVEAEIPVAARLEAKPSGSLGDSSALPPGMVISSRLCPSRRLALTAPDPDEDLRGDTRRSRLVQG